MDRFKKFLRITKSIFLGLVATVLIFTGALMVSALSMVIIPACLSWFIYIFCTNKR